MHPQQAQLDFSQNVNKRVMNINSLTAYYESVLPTLTNREKEVLDALKVLNKATCSEVCEYLTKIKGYMVMPHQLSGRFTSLKKIKEKGDKEVRKAAIKSDSKKLIGKHYHDVWELEK